MVSIGESQHQDHCMWEKNNYIFIIYPVVNHFAALAGDDGFGVILDTSDGESCVVEGHDVTFFVEGADTEAWGERVRVHYP